MTTSVPIKSIGISGTNPRRHFDKGAQAELEASVKKYGILQPVLVRPAGCSADPLAKDYLLVAGERRLRAATSAGLKEIPVVVRDLDDKAALEVQMIENLQRQDLHPIEEAEGYEKLINAHGYTADELAAKIGKSRAYIYARMKLTALCKEARKALWDGVINHSVGLLIARIPGEALQREALNEVLGDRQDVVRGAGPMTEREARRHIHDRYMLRLKEAPFDTRDAALVKAAGACTNCPKRTGNVQELFPDVQSADVCTDPACFAKKKEAHVARQLEAHAAAGHPVLKPAESAKLFWNHSDQLKTDAYVELNQRCTELGYGWDKDWKATLGKTCPPPILAVDARGELHELIKKEEAKTALKATGQKPKEPASQTRYDAKQRAREKRKRTLLAAAHMAAGEILPKLAKPLLKPDAKLWALLAQAAYQHTSIDEHAFVAKRRGLVKSQNDARNALEKLIRTTRSASGLMDLTLELLLASHWNGGWDCRNFSASYVALAKFAGVNLKKLERAAAKPKKKK